MKIPTSVATLAWVLNRLRVADGLFREPNNSASVENMLERASKRVEDRLDRSQEGVANLSAYDCGQIAKALSVIAGLYRSTADYIETQAKDFQEAAEKNK